MGALLKHFMICKAELMENQQPGVGITESIYIRKEHTVESAVPLFIGFTEKQQKEKNVLIENFSDYEMKFGGPHHDGSVLYYTVKHFFDNGGTSGYIYSLSTYEMLDNILSDNEINNNQYIIDLINAPNLAQAVSAEAKITLISFPDAFMLEDCDVDFWHAYWRTMLSFCRLRSGLFSVLQAPQCPENALKSLACFDAIDGDFGGVWWPGLVTPYLKENITVTVPPCGAVLASIQNTDAKKGIWSAPANVILDKVTYPSYSFQDASELFHSSSVSLNLIRSFPGRGTRIWGARTLCKNTDSGLQYIHNRRLISWCEVSLSQLGRMFIFEPNNQITWYKFTAIITNWLRSLWQQGGLYGEQEKDAFHVMLGLGETMTEEDIKEGKMIANIKLAISAPAEFIELTLSFNMNAVV